MYKIEMCTKCWYFRKRTLLVALDLTSVVKLNSNEDEKGYAGEGDESGCALVKKKRMACRQGACARLDATRCSGLGWSRSQIRSGEVDKCDRKVR